MDLEAARRGAVVDVEAGGLLRAQGLEDVAPYEDRAPIHLPPGGDPLAGPAGGRAGQRLQQLLEGEECGGL